MLHCGAKPLRSSNDLLSYSAPTIVFLGIYFALIENRLFRRILFFEILKLHNKLNKIKLSPKSMPIKFKVV
ncbi:hypothetical protein DESC_90055 [Desulfosarcina cetonica]|nr:hypothetical protein DESC_90055 [Desulfosarcina cetonica]